MTRRQPLVLAAALIAAASTAHEQGPAALQGLYPFAGASAEQGLAELGLMDVVERPPMHPIPPEQRETLAQIMRRHGWLD